jgi:hypothetical protein
MNKNSFKLLFVALIAGVAFASCKDENTVVDPENNPDRLFMPMFRTERNGISTSDRYYSGLVEGKKNDIIVYWYGVTGASGYRVKAIIQGRDFENPLDCFVDTIVGPDVLQMTFEDLQYKTGFRFAIKALSPKGEQYDSKWFGYGDGGHPDDYLGIDTDNRYPTPDVFWVEDVTMTSMRIVFNLKYTVNPNYDPTDPLNSEEDYLSHFEVDENGNYVVDQITVAPSADNPDLPSWTHTLTAEDKERGYVDVPEGTLTMNSVYVINGLNNNVVRYWDRLYNTSMIRMQGIPGDPILLAYAPDANDTISGAAALNACRIDTVLQNYMSDNTLAEGQVFELEPGKTYYFVNTLTMSKGFTLRCPDPNNKATVYLGLGFNKDGSPRTCNLSFGRNPNVGEMGGINVQAIIFDGINFTCENAYNFLERGPYNAGSGIGNYFINQYSQAMPFSLDAFEIRNCNFSKFVRGWIRTQGPNRKTISNFIVDNCLFYDSGVYDNNGRGYSWVDSDSNHNYGNLFNNFQMTNCTFIDSPRHDFLLERDNLAWPASVTYHINVSNNTFVNLSTRSNDRIIFDFDYLPANSSITCRNNLFVITRYDANDTRTLYQSGMDIRQNFETCVFDFANNYSTIVPTDDGRARTDGLFTSYAFSATNRGAGYSSGAYNKEGLDATKIKQGADGGLTPEELFVNPRPKATGGDDPNMHRYDLDGFYYNNTDKVRNSEIFKNNIGDPRWRKNVSQ